MAGLPTIDCVVTFLAPDEGGRVSAAFDTPTYRPHLVVGDTGRRKAVPGEDYLGVAFTGDGRPFSVSVDHSVTLSLVYWPEVDYSTLVAGATFTLREGARCVASGRVVRGIQEAPR
jgi:hypothetical protein